MHIVLTIIVAWFGTAFLAGEAMGFWHPDYRRLLIVLILTYWATSIAQGLRSRR
jgi:hypothetical protein